MNVLVAVASKHGGTRGIADAIAAELRAAGVAADARDVEEPTPVEAYDAVVLGSAIYLGGWMPAARRFLDANRGELAAVPVWLFSSGPLGADDPRPPGGPTHLPELMAMSGAREHRLFVGSLDKHRLGLGERLAAAMVKAPEGDFRDWAAIRGWAREIAAALLPVEVPADVIGDRGAARGGSNQETATE